MPEHEHVPLTDAELDKLPTFPVAALNVENMRDQLIAEVREARRLLRAVERGPDSRSSCPSCGECYPYGCVEDCKLRRYLAACAGVNRVHA